MAKYDVTFSCGHQGIVNLVGPHKERDLKLRWYSDAGLCPKCLEERQVEHRRLETEKAQEANFSRGLRPLEGTERQIAWAETIRSKIIDDCFVAYGTVSGSEVDLGILAASAIEESLNWLRDQCDASWWIDRRENRLPLILAESPYITEDMSVHMGFHKEYREFRQKVTREAAEKETAVNQQKKIDAIRDELQQIFGEKLPLKVAEYPDKRIYIGEFGKSVVEYYHDGNRYHSKGDLICNWSKVDVENVRSFCSKVASGWKALALK